MVYQMWKWVEAAKRVEKELLPDPILQQPDGLRRPLSVHLSSCEFESECEPERSTWSTMWRAPAAARAWQLGHLPPCFEHQLSWLRAGGEEQDREFAYWVLGGGGK